MAGWDGLAERVKMERWGACGDATFTRMGSGPTWPPEFYRMTRRQRRGTDSTATSMTRTLYTLRRQAGPVDEQGTAEPRRRGPLSGRGGATAGPSHVRPRKGRGPSPTRGIPVALLVKFEKRA